MDLHTIATDIAPIVQAITSLAGVLGLFLVWHQIRVTNEWNRANTQHTLLSNLPSKDLEDQVWKLLEPLEKDEHWHLRPNACPMIYDNISDWVAVKTYLNKHEQLCAAINANAVNERYAYDVHGAKIVDVFRTFETYIEYARTRAKDQALYLELEKIASRWELLSKAEEQGIREEQEQLKAMRGAKKAVK